MEEITYQKTYQEYKAELDGELQKTAEGFVRIGYLLKVARDTDILAESGYATVTEKSGKISSMSYEESWGKILGRNWILLCK